MLKMLSRFGATISRLARRNSQMGPTISHLVSPHAHGGRRMRRRWWALPLAVAAVWALLLPATAPAPASRLTAVPTAPVATPAARPMPPSRRPIEQPGRMPRGVPDRVVVHTGFMLSYNRERLQPNWVAWQLTARETEGRIGRADDFRPDPLLPAPQRVTTDDYKGSGYDRGHMCPAADMKWSARAMTECFYMSNICPQNQQLNRGSWATLEKACRRWARAEGSVYIVCGPVFRPGRGRTIGRRLRIGVSDGFYKVVLSLRPGREKAIGFYYRNTSARQSMQEAARSVDEVERLTGIDFFVNLPDRQEAALESRYSLKAWR